MPGLIGQLDSVRKSMLNRLEKLYQRRVRYGQTLSYELAEELCALSLEAKRELTVLLDFQGRVELVIVGDIETLDQIPGIQLPRPADGLAKRYAISTRLGWRPLGLGAQVTLLQFHFPVICLLMAGLSPKLPGGFSRQYGENPTACDAVQILQPLRERRDDGSWQRTCQVNEWVTARAAAENPLEGWVEWAEPVFTEQSAKQGGSQERALLIGVYTGGKQAEDALTDSLDELRQLAKSAGAIVVDQAAQVRKNPDPSTFIGSGKAEELAFWIQQHHIDVVIADDELSPAQQRNLERILRVKVIDRTELILDIFAQRAQSREGKIQVELAQLQYEMPRLKGRGRMFSQQTAVGAKGGIATRGPGETKLETDRRVLRERVTTLEKEAGQVVRHRQFQRQARKQAQTPLIALVGYTNAGKSTLMRRLTQADVLVEDRLFATLDPTIRKLHLNAESGDPAEAQDILLSDTVGFIRKLPTFLIKAFRATLEEAASADLLWHVWDVSHPDRLQHAESVQDILNTLFEELDVTPPPMWTLCNKIDRLPNAATELDVLQAGQPETAFGVSAQSGEGIDELLRATRHFLNG